MKTPLRTLLVLVSLCGAVAAHAAPKAAVNVMVTNSRNNTVAYQGRTDANGKFATGALPGGTYVVQFTAANSAAVKGKQFAMAAVGGKRAVTASAVPGEKFTGGGVAMKVEVAKGSPLTGAVGTDAAIAAAGVSKPASEPTEAVRANVKVINGKRYVWIPGPIGTNTGGRWVEEGSEAARLSTSNRRGGDGEVLRKLQDASGQGGGSIDSVTGGGVWNRGGQPSVGTGRER